MRRYIKELKPTNFSDIAATIALYRPGPMEHIPTFIDHKHGRSPIRYPHPDLQPILEETYGIIVYQDQVLLIARDFGGYTLGEADILRKAMGKKDPEIMKAEQSLYKTLMFGPSTLGRARREMIAIVVSRINDCHY